MTIGYTLVAKFCALEIGNRLRVFGGVGREAVGANAGVNQGRLRVRSVIPPQVAQSDIRSLDHNHFLVSHRLHLESADKEVGMNSSGSHTNYLNNRY